MVKKASRKKRATTKKKVGMKKAAGMPAVAVKKGAAATKKRVAVKKRGVGRPPAAAKAAESPAVELEQAFETTQSKLVAVWEKEVEAAVKALDGLRGKLERAADRQRALKDKRVAAANRHKEKRTDTNAARLEKAKAAYDAALEVADELRRLTDAARERMRSAKVSLARAVARERVLAKFEKDYAKAQETKAKGAGRRGRRPVGRPPGRPPVKGARRRGRPPKAAGTEKVTPPGEPTTGETEAGGTTALTTISDTGGEA